MLVCSATACMDSTHRPRLKWVSCNNLKCKLSMCVRCMVCVRETERDRDRERVMTWDVLCCIQLLYDDSTLPQNCSCKSIWSSSWGKAWWRVGTSIPFLHTLGTGATLILPSSWCARSIPIQYQERNDTAELLVTIDSLYKIHVDRIEIHYHVRLW